MNEAAGPAEAQGRPVLNTQKPFGRTRPTNNQLLYKAYLRWEHYSHQLHGDPKLPAETEACASVTSAFLQVMSILFEVESLRVREPRNILQILSTNTRRTKVVELTTGTHRVPDELKKHSLSDGVGGQYSTNLDRNRYGADDQYLSTVIRYDLEYLRLCPCLVDVEIIDAKNGSGTILVSAGPEYCLCNRDAAQANPAAPGRPPHGASIVPGWNTTEVKAPAPLPPSAGTVATLPTVRPGTADLGLVCNTAAGTPGAQQPAMPGSAGKSDGSNLFDALLLAASGGRDKKQAGQAGAAQPADAVGEEAQVSSKSVEWPMVPPGSKRQRSRLHQTPGSAPPGATLEDLSPHPEADAPVKTPRGNKRGAPSTAEGQPQVQASREHSGENRVPEQTPLAEAGDLGSLSAVEAGAGRAGAFFQVGASAKPAGDAGETELRRLQQEVRSLKAGNKRMEAALEESRARELAAAANAEAMRAQLDALLPAGSGQPEGAPSGATSAEKKVLGQATWEESKERHAQRSNVQMPRIVYTLRVEVQRLQAKIQEAEARASASQRIAEEAQRELRAVVAASNSPVAFQARQAIDAEKAILRQQLMEAQAALQSVKAEKQALEECLSATASAQRHTPNSAQAAPVTPQPHRSGNPSSAKLSEGTEKKPLVSSPGEKGASALLTLSSQDAQQATPPLVSQAQPAAYPINGPSQSMQQMVGAGLPNMPNGPMSMAPMQEGFPSTIADNYQGSPEPAAALAMATPEQIQQALMALAQAASASAGGQLRPDDLQALFGPQWATLVAMPGGPISLPPEQLQQLATSEATAAFTQLVSNAPMMSQPVLAPPMAMTAAAAPLGASQAPPAAGEAQAAPSAAQGPSTELQQKAPEQASAPAAAAAQETAPGEFDISQVLNLSAGNLPTSA